MTTSFIWPTFRHDSRNSGCSSLAGVYTGGEPWFFQTGKGIFSTPVIDASGVIYVGSADHYFYALNPDGGLRWKYKTGEIIDSAGALSQINGEARITFISGDGKMYNLRTADLELEKRKVWEFEAQLRKGISYNRWFEGNVAVGPDGTLYAGNTNFMYYAVSPDGSLKWTHATGSNNWSQAAFGADGSIYWGSLDTFIRRVTAGGAERWRKRTLGFVAASAAIGSDGTVYIGSFDSNFYALEAASGRVRWKFATGDHIYASAALAADAAGQTCAIYITSTDGMLYALRPDGSLRWKYDAGDAVRSSPVIGKTPDGSADIIYFGCGNGILYAINENGSLRWQYDTNADDPELIDRNDLNGSPALGKTGVYIGGEHGRLVYVPYDYPLQPQLGQGGQTQRRQAEQPAEFCGLYYVSPGGNTQPDFPAELPTSAMLTLRLVVRQNGETLPARLYNSPLGAPQDALVVELEPPVRLAVEHSADGRYIYIRPLDFLQPGASYTLKVSGRYYTGGLRLGNLSLGGRFAGRFASTFQFTARQGAAALPLFTGSQACSGLEWTRLAAPIPAMLPSLNQIGFDYIDWMMAPVLITPPDERGQGKMVLWAIGAKQAPDGSLIPDPASDFCLPLSGRYQGSDFVLTNRGFPMAITGITIPFNLFELRGSLNENGATLLPAAFADTQALSIPTFGPYLVIAGLANNWYQKLLVAGTFVTRKYSGPGCQRPPGVEVERISLQAPTGTRPGQATAWFKLQAGTDFRTDDHRCGLLLIDLETNEALALDYHANLSTQLNPQGGLQSVTLNIPAKTQLPKNLQIMAVVDVFPLARENINL